MEYAVAIIVCWLLAPIVAASMARSRGCSPTAYFILGLLFGWLAVLFLATRPVLKRTGE